MTWDKVPTTIREQAPVDWTVVSDTMLRKFKSILNSARNEKPLQELFEKYPAILIGSVIGPHTTWVFPRVRLPKPDGTLWVPDFMVCDWTSVGPQWTIVELESPTFRRATKDGTSATCVHAVQQVNDYRRHLREHPNLVRDGGFPGIEGYCDGLVVIGRTDEALTQIEANRLAEFRGQRIEIASYDRLLGRFRDLLRFRNHARQDLRRLVKKRAPNTHR
jgi:hypothetical protein